MKTVRVHISRQQRKHKGRCDAAVTEMTRCVWAKFVEWGKLLRGKMFTAILSRSKV